jgi:hypothetical protein
MVIMATEGIRPSESFVLAAPRLEPELREMASAKLAAISEFYEARAKMSRLNKELFDKGLIIGHDLLCW